MTSAPQTVFFFLPLPTDGKIIARLSCAAIVGFVIGTFSKSDKAETRDPLRRVFKADINLLPWRKAGSKHGIAVTAARSLGSSVDPPSTF